MCRHSHLSVTTFSIVALRKFLLTPRPTTRCSTLLLAATHFHSHLLVTTFVKVASRVFKWNFKWNIYIYVCIHSI